MIIWSAPIALFLIAGWGIGHGFILKSVVGFLLVVASLFVAVLGWASVFYILGLLPANFTTLMKLSSFG